MKLIFVLFVGLSLVGCMQPHYPEEQIVGTIEDCTLDNEAGYRQRIIHQEKMRVDVRRDFNSCMAGNVHRDVVYNDTNELAETCKKYANEVNGVNPILISGGITGSIYLNIQKCGGK